MKELSVRGMNWTKRLAIGFPVSLVLSYYLTKYYQVVGPTRITCTCDAFIYNCELLCAVPLETDITGTLSALLIVFPATIVALLILEKAYVFIRPYFS